MTDLLRWFGWNNPRFCDDCRQIVVESTRAGWAWCHTLSCCFATAAILLPCEVGRSERRSNMPCPTCRLDASASRISPATTIERVVRCDISNHRIADLESRSLIVQSCRNGGTNRRPAMMRKLRPDLSDGWHHDQSRTLHGRRSARSFLIRNYETRSSKVDGVMEALCIVYTCR